MTVSPQAFPESGPDNIPDLHAIESDAARCLWVLYVSKECVGQPWMTPGEMEMVLRDRYGLHLPRQRIPGLLAGLAGCTSKKKVGGRFAYQIMKAGVDELGTPEETVTFIDPEQALSHIRQAEDIFRAQTGVIRVCDPYIDGRTLDYLAECQQATEIRLLTANINKPGPLRRDMAAFAKQHKVPLEVRQAAQGQLHDRYVIDDSGMLIFGTSLNSFGRKQSFVIRAGVDIRTSVAGAFDTVWNVSPRFT